MMVGSPKAIIIPLNVFQTSSERIFPVHVLLLLMISLFGNLVKLLNGWVYLGILRMLRCKLLNERVVINSPPEIGIIFMTGLTLIFALFSRLRLRQTGLDIGAKTESAPVNGSFSLIKSMTVKSAKKSVYEANDIHKVIFIKKPARLQWWLFKKCGQKQVLVSWQWCYHSNHRRCD